MKNYKKEQKQYLDKIDELLSIRESKRSSLKDTDRMLMQGLLASGQVNKVGEDAVNYADKLLEQLDEIK